MYGRVVHTVKTLPMEKGMKIAQQLLNCFFFIDREDQLNCILPAYPKNGWYVAPSKPDGKPGSVYSSIYLNVTCDRGHVAKGQTSIFCFQGNWSSPMPECIRGKPAIGHLNPPRCDVTATRRYPQMRCLPIMDRWRTKSLPHKKRVGHCNLNPHPSVTYYCKQDGEDGLEMECDSIVPSGTVVRAECRKPNYNHEGIHPFMRCIDGVFDYIATCEIECGIITPQGNELISYARDALRAEVPWHVGVYRKLNETPSYQCAGSLISTSAIISVAHCYWDHYEKKKKPASNFVVAAGKLYFPWDDPRDEYNAQKRSVKSIDIPSRFHGQNANFQGDIAILIVDKLFELKPYLRPVCLNFDFNFNKRQLRNGNLGKFSGWGYTEEMKQSLALQTMDLPYVGVNECLSLVPKDFEVLVTSDKFCAGYTNGTAVCKGDSGGGISFPETERGVVRYYLRGVLSVSPSKENNCDLNSLAAYTEVFKHRDFIEESRE
ncbi:Limulus clotting factor C [Papilio machaon]|uniref:Limulus clotting factor C n=1 Tax=Papilio machaon TaxID=76193 RepID=A0A0N1PIX0_PAPMA|nr:Limulus clotting factor C [Papilio machaon]